MSEFFEPMEHLDDSNHPATKRHSLKNIEAEQLILAALLSQGSLFQHVAGWLDPLHFYQTAHQLMFQAMVELFAGQCPITVVSVTTHLRENGQADQIGGASYAMDLVISGMGMGVEAGGETSLRYFGRKIIELAKRRAVVQTADEIAESACDLSQTDYAECAQTLLLSLTNAYQVEECADTGRTIDNALGILEAELTTPGGVTGLSTGLRSLDRATHGFKPHQLITLAARPGGGKSALALNIASHVALKERKPVLYISLEMESAELMKRLLKAMAGSESDLSRMQQAAEELRPHRHRLILDDAAGQTLTTI